jgi:signal transduction histidine kinase
MEAQKNLEEHQVQLEELVEQKSLEYKQQKEIAEKANEAKSKFLASMNHELRSPLNAVIGFSQLLEIDEEDEQKRSYIKNIITSGDHILLLIDEILDLSKIESGNEELSMETHNLNKILKDALAMISSAADKRSIQIDNKIDFLHDTNIKVDQLRFKQVLLNILSNAIKYNRENGKVTIDSSSNNNMISISITDTGIGLTPEQQDKLFKPFERLEAANSKIEGTGLGLVISKNIMELMGGDITVESEVGKGSSFLIHALLS